MKDKHRRFILGQKALREVGKTYIWQYKVSLQYTPQYKYLAFISDEFLNYEVGINILADSKGRANGSVINRV